MRPVCLLDRTKNLHQFDGLYFISTSQRIFFARTSAEKIYANLADLILSVIPIHLWIFYTLFREK